MAESSNSIRRDGSPAHLRIFSSPQRRTPTSRGKGGRWPLSSHPSRVSPLSQPNHPPPHLLPSLSDFLAALHSPSSRSRSTLPPLPFPFPPFFRPFTSLSRGVYAGLSFPIDGRRGVEERSGEGEEVEEEEEAQQKTSAAFSPSALSFSHLSSIPFSSSASPSSFIPPHFDLPYTPSSPFRLLTFLQHPPPPPPPINPNAVDKSLSGSCVFTLRLQSSYLSSDTSPLILIINCGGSDNSQLTLLSVPSSVLSPVENWHRQVAGRAPGQSSTVPAAPPPPTTSPELCCLSSDVMEFVVVQCMTPPFDSPICRISSSQSDSSVASSVYSSVDDLPLLITQTQSRAYIHRIIHRADGFRLQLVDQFDPYTPPLLCLSPNIGLCSSTCCEIACVDAGGCIYIWSMDLEEKKEEEEVDDIWSNKCNADGVTPSLSSVHRRVSSIWRSSWDAPVNLFQHPQISFARCFFSPHPRSLLLVLEDRIMRIEINQGTSMSYPQLTDRPSAQSSLAQPLPLPSFASMSVPTNRYRVDPTRPQPIRDHFFPYQIYRQHNKAKSQEEPKSKKKRIQEQWKEEGKERDGAMREGSRQQQEGEEEQLDVEELQTPPNRLARAKNELAMESGANDSHLLDWIDPLDLGSGQIVAACGISEMPCLLILLTTSFLEVLDIRWSSQPIIEWQLPSPQSHPCHLSALLIDTYENNTSSLLIVVWQKETADVIVYHCLVPCDGGASAAVTYFAPLLLPSFPSISSPVASAFSLLSQPPPSLTGLSFLIHSSPISRLFSSSSSSLQSSSLPSLSIFQQSASGLLVVQEWMDHREIEEAHEREEELSVDDLIEEEEDGEDAEEDRVGSSSSPVESLSSSSSSLRLPLPPPLSASLSSALSGIVFPHDAAPPAWLSQALIRPSDFLDLTPAFYGSASAAAAASSSSVLSASSSSAVDSVFSSILSNSQQSEMLLSLLRIPRSAYEVAIYCIDQGWIENGEGEGEEEEYKNDRTLRTSDQRSAAEVSNIVRSMYQQLRQLLLQEEEEVEKGDSISLPLRHVHRTVGVREGKDSHSGWDSDEKTAALALPPSLHSCSCSSSSPADLPFQSFVGDSSTCSCPTSCCSSPNCLSFHSVLFHSIEQILPEVRGFIGKEDEEKEDGKTAGEKSLRGGVSGAIRQPLVDLSQDMNALMNLMSQQSSQAVREKSVGSLSFSTERHSPALVDVEACNNLLMSMRDQWNEWEQQAASAGKVEGNDDMRGGWQGLNNNINTRQKGRDGEGGEVDNFDITETNVEMEDDDREIDD